MLKMYHSGKDEGGSAEFWEKTWLDSAFEEALRFCDVDPLGPLLRRHLRPGRRVLEGGCGRGQYVAYYDALGARVVGLDFARNALAELRRRDSDLMLCAGDVGALPFRSASFDVYYSGGVVEHFESGPEPSLREARRVLRDDGVLLVSVPYLSPLRKILAPFKRGDRRFVSTTAPDGDPRRRAFFQYAFTRREFERTLRGCGFHVQAVQGYAIVWGLGEVPGVGRLLTSGALATPAVAAGGEGASPGPRAAARASTGAETSSWLKRLAVSEDEGVPILGRMLPLLRWATANMIMFVCVPDGPARD